MSNIKMMVDKKYIDGQTDGMKLYKKTTKKSVSYTFAANTKDAAIRFKAGLVLDPSVVHFYTSTR